MSYQYRGMAAGLAAALVLSAFLAANAEMGLIPPLDFAALLGGLTGTGIIGGWLLHLLAGTLLGALFAWLDPDLPGDSLRQRGLIFSLVPWSVMMFVLTPLAGYGVFGLGYGVLLPLSALVLHLIFGAVMGDTYDWLLRQSVPLRYRQPHRRSPAVIANAPALAPESTASFATLKSAKTMPRRPTSAPAATADLRPRGMTAAKPHAAAESIVALGGPPPAIGHGRPFARPARRPKI